MPEAVTFTDQQIAAAAVSVLCLNIRALVHFYILSVICTSFKVLWFDLGVHSTVSLKKTYHKMLIL